LGELGILRVGVSPLYVERLFVPAAAALHRQRPAARLKLMLHLNETLLASLRGGEIDLAINALPAETPDDLEVMPLVEDVLCLVVREHHPLLSKPELRLPDLAGALWMLPGQGIAVRRKIEDRLGFHGLASPDVVFEISTSALGQLNRLVRQSDLVTVMSESMLHTPWGEGLTPLPFEDARYPRTIGVLTRKSAVLPPLAPRFMELLTRYASSNGE
jgi:DNA-binding transcriptional LysR family regulator